MTIPAARLSRRSVASALAAALAGCAQLLGVSAPGKLYRLTAKSTYPPGLQHLSRQLLVDVPVGTGGLDTTRIALSRSAVSIDYFADSEWTNPIPLLVQTALLESFENSRTLTAVDRESSGLNADFILRTEIRHFEAVYDSPDRPPEVWVAIYARLVDSRERSIAAQASFERRGAAAANDVPSIVLAFDEALGGTMKDIVIWTATNPALSPKRR
jgi:cholesterol transport system auxiliary component